ncbi:MAG: hypothetical protein QJR01_00890 [Kyrpidia sp.]|nr:hypothetical protein [Kyrpidia sp.]
MTKEWRSSGEVDVEMGWVKPMEPVRGPLVGEEGYWVQLKFDGVRLMAEGQPSKVALYNRRGQERTSHYPELQNLKDVLQRHDFLLDGELIAPDAHGRPDFSSLIRRDAAGPSGARRLQEIIPVQFVPFDVLRWDGRWLIDQPIESRLEYLQNIPKSAELVPAGSWHDQPAALWSQVVARNLEGVVAKRAGSPYLPGRTSPLWRKTKHRRTLRAWIGGMVIREGRLRSLCLGRMHPDGLYYIGNAGSGVPDVPEEELRRWSAHLRQDRCPFRNVATIPGAIWWTPEIQADVEYAEWTPSGRLRQPAIKRFVPSAVNTGR